MLGERAAEGSIVMEQGRRVGRELPESRIRGLIERRVGTAFREAAG